jgi:hypothetical protein
MGLLRASGTACVLLAGDAKARKEKFKRAASARGLNRWSMSQNYKTPELKFRAVVDESACEVRFEQALPR